MGERKKEILSREKERVKEVIRKKKRDWVKFRTITRQNIREKENKENEEKKHWETVGKRNSRKKKEHRAR